MSRTQIYLGEEELKLLDRASEETGASRSELPLFGCAVSRELQQLIDPWGIKYTDPTQ